MKHFIYIIIAVFFLTNAGFAAESELISSFRCESSIIQKGTQDFEVKENCGEPLSKEDVGYTDGALRLKIEKWVYESDGGNMRILYFKAGILERIETYKPSN